MKFNKKKFLYLISPNKINDVRSFLVDLNLVLKSKKVSFFQLRIKKEKLNKKLMLAKKICKICKNHNVKFIINDDPYIASEVNADGCHIGQSDKDINDVKKILKNKIIGVTCHNSMKLAKEAYINGASYIALGAFFKTKTKKVVHKASINNLIKIKNSINLPVVAIGGINEKNYKKLLLNKADFLAISSYIWDNTKLKPYQAVERLK